MTSAAWALVALIAIIGSTGEESGSLPALSFASPLTRPQYRVDDHALLAKDKSIAPWTDKVDPPDDFKTEFSVRLHSDCSMLTSG